MTKKLFKLQWPIATNGTPQILCYTKDGKQRRLLLARPELKKYFGGELKIFMFCEVDEAGAFTIDWLQPHQPDPGW